MTDGVLERLDGIDEVRVEWAALAEASQNPFATPEWCEGWLAHIGSDSEPHLFAARRDDGTLFAILPLVVTRGRCAKARFLGFGPSNELGRSPRRRPRAAGSAHDRRLRRPPATGTSSSGTAPGGGWADASGRRSWSGRRTRSCAGRGGWDQYLTSRSSNFRQGTAAGAPTG